MRKKIIHQLSLVGIGGVQQSFIPYFEKAIKESRFEHQVYGMHELDSNYESIKDYYNNINKSFLSKLKFLYYVFSKKYIVHFYNNLGSASVNNILKLIPSSNIIFHERGGAWNAEDKDVSIYQKNASKASTILVNSQASKIMLIKRFGIEDRKIRVIYNGFLTSKSENFIQKKERFSNEFSVGYIGRLDTPKGVHVLIETAKILSDYNFYIAGSGGWEEKLKLLASGYDNIFFIGRVKKPLEFISKVDLIIVPSIREPLGNAIIEAGFCNKVVIASNVDGIAEIIDDKVNGILLEPKNELSFNEVPEGAVPIPKFVVNPKTQALQTPKEIDVNELCLNISKLKADEKLRERYSRALLGKVKCEFTIEKYFMNLEEIYHEIFNAID